jgi:hypothetical protein
VIGRGLDSTAITIYRRGFLGYIKGALGELQRHAVRKLFLDK